MIFVIFIVNIFFWFKDRRYIYTTTIIHPIFTNEMASSDSHHCTRATIFYGPVINPVNLNCFDVLPHCLLSIDHSGNIEWMIDNVYEY
jgi:hypothetical protein